MRSNWQTKKVKDLCLFIVDCVNKTAPRVEGPTAFRMLRTTNIKSGVLDTENCDFVTEETFKKWTRRASLRPKDILLTREAPIGEVAQVYNGDGLFLGQRIMQYRPNPEVVDADFLFFTFLSPILKNQFGLHEGSGSTVSHIRVGDCSEFDIPCPPLSEQRRISKVLAPLFHYTHQLERQNTTLEIIAQTIFKSWFVNFDPVHVKAAGETPDGMSPTLAALFPSEFEESELGLIPKGWQVKSFGDCLHTAIGGDWGSETKGEKHTVPMRIIRGTDIPKIRCSDVTNVPTRFLAHGKADKRKLVAGDIVIEVSGGSRDQATGRAVRVSSRLLDAYSEAFAPTSFCRMFRPKTGYSEFLTCRLYEHYKNGVFWKYQVQSTGIANLQTKFFLESDRFAVPPEDLLHEFSKIAQPMLDAAFSPEIQLLSELRNELLTRLISGKIRIREAEEAVAEVLGEMPQQEQVA